MATFRPSPKTPEPTVEVTLRLTQAQVSAVERVGTPHRLTVSDVLEQFVGWALDGQLLAPAPKPRARKPKAKE